MKALDELRNQLSAIDPYYSLKQLSKMQWVCKASFNDEEFESNELSAERAIVSVLKKIHANQHP